jgi:hypothetical protein
MALKITKLGLGIFLVLITTLARAQEDGSSLSNTFKRSHLSHSSTYKPLKSIYKRPGKNRMFSNDCVHDVTSEMGFEYVILTGDCEKALSNLNGFELELHNFTTGLGIALRHGPFWKHKIKKRYRLCKERMGDVIE